jgi:hypothetical protein
MLVLVVLGLPALPRPAAAQPTAGFVENFTSGTGEFGGGSTYTNPGTGGVGGAGDGYLHIENTGAFNFGTRSLGPNFTGDFLAAGITRIRFWLNDVGADQSFEIHFGIGAGASNFWLYNTGFAPPENAWAEFEVDLTNEALFTQTRGTGTFAQALSGASNILIRHDLLPLTDTPDAIAGELGLDQVMLVGAAPVEPGTWGRIKAQFR